MGVFHMTSSGLHGIINYETEQDMRQNDKMTQHKRGTGAEIFGRVFSIQNTNNLS